MATVKDLGGFAPRAEILTVEAGCSVAKAARKMRAERLGCLLVIDRLQRIAGTLSEQDIVQKVVAAGKDPRKTPVRQAVNHKAPRCGPDTPLGQARRTLEDRGEHFLPVIDGSVPLGILSREDLLAHQLHRAEQGLSDPGQAGAARADRGFQGRCPYSAAG